MFKHLKVWNSWRKKNMNGSLYHILVLFGIVKSPTFEVEKIFFDWPSCPVIDASRNNKER